MLDRLPAAAQPVGVALKMEMDLVNYPHRYRLTLNLQIESIFLDKYRMKIY